MDYQLTDTFTYWWPVTVRIPNPDPDHAGEIVEQTFKMQFMALDRDEQIAEQQKLDELTAVDDIKAHEHDLLRRVCKNWVGVVGDEKAPVGFSSDAFDKALQKGWFRQGVYDAFNESMSGEEARMGNSGKPRASGLSAAAAN